MIAYLENLKSATCFTANYMSWTQITISRNSLHTANQIASKKLKRKHFNNLMTVIFEQRSHRWMSCNTSPMCQLSRVFFPDASSVYKNGYNNSMHEIRDIQIMWRAVLPQKAYIIVFAQVLQP